jgi:hypothetical protein
MLRLIEHGTVIVSLLVACISMVKKKLNRELHQNLFWVVGHGYYIEIMSSGAWWLYWGSGQWDMVIILRLWAVRRGYCIEVQGSGTWSLYWDYEQWGMVIIPLVPTCWPHYKKYFFPLYLCKSHRTNWPAAYALCSASWAALIWTFFLYRMNLQF